jgi:hypothetical protein
MGTDELDSEEYDFYGCKISPERIKDSRSIQKSLGVATISQKGKEDRAINRVMLSLFLRQNQRIIEVKANPPTSH